MAKIPKSLIAITIALTIAFAGAWFYSNMKIISGKTPLEAAVKSFAKWQKQHAGDSDLLVTDIPPLESGPNFGTIQKFRISKITTGKKLAEIQVASFLGLGWQEYSYTDLTTHHAGG